MRRTTAVTMGAAVLIGGYLLANAGVFPARAGRRGKAGHATVKGFVSEREDLGRFAAMPLPFAPAALAGFITEDAALETAAFKSSIGEGYKHKARVFDPAWLTRKDTRFTLSAVVLRPDRRLRATDSCGEIRFVYRLGLSNERGSSDLPFTVAALAPFPKVKGCELSDMPPAPAFDTIEYNVQLSRYPHDGTDKFSDQAHYGMGVLLVDPATKDLKRGTLAGTPDTARLATDAALRKELWDYLGSPVAQSGLDDGNLEIPEKFLATHATSVTPFGMGRLANRPYSQLFAGAEYVFAPKPDGFRRSKRGLLRRLDTLTCTGCHVARSIAGFHALGQVASETTGVNSLLDPFSGYVRGIQAWRELVPAFRETGVPIVHPDVDRVAGTALGAVCGMGDPAFAEWKCAPGFVCRADVPRAFDGEVGQCVLDVKSETGRACDVAELVSSAEPLKDQYLERRQENCLGAGFCTKSIYGFPGGFCSGGCEASTATDRCARIPLLGPFTICLDEGKSFKTCLDQHNAQVLMPRCQSNTDCRQDYVCSGVEATGGGICAPNYFVPQLTIESHPF